MSALAIVAGVTGLVVSLWRCTLWAIFALLAVCIHNAVDFAVNKWSPSKTRMLLLKPDATFEGFMGGVVAVFAFFTFVSVLTKITVILAEKRLMMRNILINVSFFMCLDCNKSFGKRVDHARANQIEFNSI